MLAGGRIHPQIQGGTRQMYPEGRRTYQGGMWQMCPEGRRTYQGGMWQLKRTYWMGKADISSNFPK